MNITKDKVSHILLNMGSDAGAVARTLEAAFVRGVRGEYDQDPIARYLSKLLTPKGTTAVYFEATEVTISWEACGEAEQVYTPPAVAEFMRQFDGGKWDHLVASEVYKGSRAPNGFRTVGGNHVPVSPTLADAILGEEDEEQEGTEAWA